MSEPAHADQSSIHSYTPLFTPDHDPLLLTGPSKPDEYDSTPLLSFEESKAILKEPYTTQDPSRTQEALKGLKYAALSSRDQTDPSDVISVLGNYIGNKVLIKNCTQAQIDNLFVAQDLIAQIAFADINGSSASRALTEFRQTKFTTDVVNSKGEHLHDRAARHAMNIALATKSPDLKNSAVEFLTKSLLEEKPLEEKVGFAKPNSTETQSVVFKELSLFVDTEPDSEARNTAFEAISIHAVEWNNPDASNQIPVVARLAGKMDKVAVQKFINLINDRTDASQLEIHNPSQEYMDSMINAVIAIAEKFDHNSVREGAIESLANLFELPEKTNWRNFLVSHQDVIDKIKTIALLPGDFQDTVVDNAIVHLASYAERPQVYYEGGSDTANMATAYEAVDAIGYIARIGSADAKDSAFRSLRNIALTKINDDLCQKALDTALLIFHNSELTADNKTMALSVAGEVVAATLISKSSGQDVKSKIHAIDYLKQLYKGTQFSPEDLTSLVDNLKTGIDRMTLVPTEDLEQFHNAGVDLLIQIAKDTNGISEAVHNKARGYLTIYSARTFEQYKQYAFPSAQNKASEYIKSLRK